MIPQMTFLYTVDVSNWFSLLSIENAAPMMNSSIEAISAWVGGDGMYGGGGWAAGGGLKLLLGLLGIAMSLRSASHRSEHA